MYRVAQTVLEIMKQRRRPTQRGKEMAEEDKGGAGGDVDILMFGRRGGMPLGFWGWGRSRLMVKTMVAVFLCLWGWRCVWMGSRPCTFRESKVIEARRRHKGTKRVAQ